MSETQGTVTIKNGGGIVNDRLSRNTATGQPIWLVIQYIFSDYWHKNCLRRIIPNLPCKCSYSDEYLSKRGEYGEKGLVHVSYFLSTMSL